MHKLGGQMMRSSRHLMVRLACVLWLFLGVATQSIAQTNSTITLSTRITHYIDGRIESDMPRVQFTCDDRIHGVAALPELASGEHEIEIRWLGPTGELEHRQDFRFAIPSSSTVKKTIYLSSFIEFRNAGGLVSLFDPSAGLDAFIGNWNVVVLDNEGEIAANQFSVIC